MKWLHLFPVLSQTSKPTAASPSSTLVPSVWTRRTWLTTAVFQPSAVALIPWRYGVKGAAELRSSATRSPGVRPARQVVTARDLPDHHDLQVLAQRAVEAARTAGADYADARLTRNVSQQWRFGGLTCSDIEVVGVGVRALVHGYWGFSASPLWAGDPAGSDTIVQLARAAVAQATVNAKGSPRTVALGPPVTPTGTWVTPITIDPIALSLEEKGDAMGYWMGCAQNVGLAIDKSRSWMMFTRQERIVATSDGAVYTQTTYESGANIEVKGQEGASDPLHYIADVTGNVPLEGLGFAGKGWDLLLEAKIPEQIRASEERIRHQLALDARTRPSTIGRYTLVCDGATMASILEQTLGVATQVDRALGYEANAGGTSFLNDPLGMVGHLPVASPLVTVTANRTAPTQLATVKWDDEGVEPHPFTLVKDGVLNDFQTTREQAAWLAPYYHAQGRPVRSNGCAAAEDGLCITMQHMPNLALAPNATEIRLEDLVADVKDGILIEGGRAMQVDFQVRTGLVVGAMRKITNGRLGASLQDGAVLFDTMDLWKRVIAMGGLSTQNVQGTSTMFQWFYTGKPLPHKGQPRQATSHSVQAVAATIANQPLIDITKKA